MAATIGCGEDQEAVSLITEQQMQVAPAQSSNSQSTHERLTQIIKSQDGELYGITHRWDKSKNLDSAVEWGYRHFDHESENIEEFEFLTLGSRFSNLIRIQPDQYQFYDEYRYQDADGQIISSLQKYRFDASTKHLYDLEKSDFAWATFSIKQPENYFLGEESTLKLRNALREVYAEDLLIPNPMQLPLQTNHLLVVGDYFESLAIPKNGGKSLSLRLLSSDLSRTSETVLCRSDQTTSNFLVKSINQSSPSKLNLQLLRYRNNQSEIEIVNERIIDSPYALSVNSCLQLENELFITGSIRYQSKDKWQIWVAKYKSEESNAKIKFEVFKTESHSIPYVIEFWKKSKLIVIGGKTNFSQARTGSISHSDGLLLFLSPNLDSGSKKIIYGDRSTFVTTLLVDNQNLVVGGVTNAPSTHSRWEGASVFIQKINQTNVRYKK